MALLSLLALAAVASAIMLLAPLKRFRQELPTEPVFGVVVIECLPVVIATGYLLAAYEQLPPESVQPALDGGLLLGIAGQLVATSMVLRRTPLAWPKIAAYAFIASIGSFVAVLLIAWFTR